MRRRVDPAARRRSNTRTGLALLALIAALLYFAFGGSLPLRSRYDVEAIVSNATQIHAGSPVRIAGVNVGRVTGVSRGPGTTARLHLRIDDRGRPIHRDATLKIRPRLFLEGNFFVDLRPGTPGSPELPDGGTIPLAQTAVPVQFDQVLTTLQSDTRGALVRTLREYGTALDHGGAEAINRSFRPSAPAFRGMALVGQESLGTRPDDLPVLVGSGERVLRTLDARRARLASLVTHFARTMGAFGDRRVALAASTRGLDGLTREAPAALADLDTSLPPLQRLGNALRPLARRAPRTLDLAVPLVDELGRLVAPQELPALLGDLHPTLAALARFERPLGGLLERVTPVARCAVRNLLPPLKTPVDDGALSSHRAPWQDFLNSMVGLASASQNFDANGPEVRYLNGGSELSVSTGRLPGGEVLEGLAGSPLLGSRPARPTHAPPFAPDVPCATQQPVDLHAATHAGPSAVPARVAKLPVAERRALLERVRVAAARAVAHAALGTGGAR